MFTLPKLPYSFDALEPFIDAKTMEIHYSKHHQTYVDKLNLALDGKSDLASKDVRELLKGAKGLDESIKQAVINHGGGHFNHTFFWNSLGLDGAKEPVGRIKLEIEKAFGSFESFKEKFVKSASTLFGSGWTWLASNEDKSGFHIHNHPNQENPLLHGHIPVLGLDVWEHAYYLKYQNRRAEYIEAFWNIVNWDKVSKSFGE